MKMKKLTALMSAVMLAVCAVPMGASAEILMGDVNQDGVVDSQDGDLLLKYADIMNDAYYCEHNDYTAEDHERYLTYGDINGDGFVTTEDIVLIGELYSDITLNTEMGDVNHDGFINAVDATAVLEYYAYCSTNNYDKITEAQHENFKKYGDVFSDGRINAIDASYILAIYAGKATELPE